MYKLTWEHRAGDRREASAVLLPITCSLSHALAEVAQVLCDKTAELHTLTLEQLGVVANEYVVKATLVRYEREGL
jgi:hypothetical protein